MFNKYHVKLVDVHEAYGATDATAKPALVTINLGVVIDMLIVPY